MKKILFATTALAGLTVAGVASAEIALFGDARLGIGYNIRNNGTPDFEELEFDDDGFITPDSVDSDGNRRTTEDLRAVSRVRFGVTMTGESDSGITFGATIRADNAGNGQGGDFGQRAGDVFVSGAWGTLTFGDTNGADEQHVGDAGGNLSLTGLNDLNETVYISNGGGFGDDDGPNFASNPNARPTVRYDYNFGGLGFSVSTNRDLNDVGVGASYTAEFGGGSVTGGLGYYDFNEFDTGLFASGGERAIVKGGEQYSAGLTGTFGGFSAGVVYTASSSESETDTISGDLDILYLSAGYEFDAFSVLGYYNTILTGNDGLEVFDERDAYGLTAQYDLGGGASVNMGVQRNYGRDSIGDVGEVGFIPGLEDSTVADFGIKMSF